MTISKQIHKLLKIISSKFSLIFLGVVCCVQLSVLSAAAYAQPSVISKVQGLTVSPLRTELRILPGTVQSGNVTIYNNTVQNMTVKMSAEGFGVTDVQYDYSFDPGSALVQWVHFTPSSFTLMPGKSQVVGYTISVPIGTEPRGHYISIFASTTVIGNSGVTSEERVASLLYITVSGKVTMRGHLLSLDTPWLTGGSANWSATVQNTGTTHFRTAYNLTVETVWGSPIALTSKNTLILPSSVRLVEDSIPQIRLPGIYKLVFDLSMGDAPTAYVTHYILYMPIYGFIVIAAVLFYVAILVSRRVTKNREMKLTTK